MYDLGVEKSADFQYFWKLLGENECRTHDLAQACLFFPSVDFDKFQETLAIAKKHTLWNNGRNNFLFANLHNDNTIKSHKLAPESIWGFTSAMDPYFRHGVESKETFDISINNQVYTKYFDDSVVQKPFENRKHLACFSGTRYFRREAGNRIRTSLKNLHDGSDFLVVSTCHQWEINDRNDSKIWNGEYTGEHIKKSSIPTAEELKQCEKDQEYSHQHHWNYTYMLNECKFSLCPRGMGQIFYFL
jgi:hypothetical protein